MSVEPEIFPTFQHKVEWVPHFARVSEVRHMQEVKLIGSKLQINFESR